jgi:hypothetical protein
VSGSLVDLVVQRATAALSGLSPTERSDTYVVSFYVNDEGDDPRRPVLEIGTNTESKVRESTPGPTDEPRWPIASDASEARWNFAFWLQNCLAVIGGSADPEGEGAIGQLFAELGLSYDDDDVSDEALEVHQRMTSAFVDVCLQAVRRLHDSVVPGIFGRDLPVIVHELEYYDEIAEQNLSCNEPGLVAGFTQWIGSM